MCPMPNIDNNICVSSVTHELLLSMLAQARPGRARQLSCPPCARTCRARRPRSASAPGSATLRVGAGARNAARPRVRLLMQVGRLTKLVGVHPGACVYPPAVRRGAPTELCEHEVLLSQRDQPYVRERPSLPLYSYLELATVATSTRGAAGRRVLCCRLFITRVPRRLWWRRGCPRTRARWSET